MKTMYWLLLTTVLLVACQTPETLHKERAALPDKGDYFESHTKRKIVYDASMRLDVKNVDSALVAAREIAKKYEGYTQSIETSSTTIRIKNTRLNEAMYDLSKLGKIKWKNIKGDDVTDTYTDYQIRLDNAEKARTRYLELLNKATTVDEILKIEKELERLNENIDLIKGKMKRIDHLASFSTVTVYFQEKTKPGILGYPIIGLYKGIKWLFVRN